MSLFNHHLTFYDVAFNRIQISFVKLCRHHLRHSHASLLIELGFSPVLIANRLGHENISITLNTYSHLYPNKQSELISKLEDSYKLVSF